MSSHAAESTFRVANVRSADLEGFEVRIGHDGVGALVRELEALEAGGAARAIAAQDTAILVLPDEHVSEVARALEHIGRQTGDRKLHDARRDVCAYLGLEPLEYTLYSEGFACGHEPTFISRSGFYVEGERLVASASLTLRVAKVVVEPMFTPFALGSLIVEDAI